MILGNPVRGPIEPESRGRFYRSQAFGCTGSKYEPALGTCAHFHRAIDVSHGDGACGKDVISAAAGTVIYTGTLLDGAHAVVVRHADGYATGYGHTGSYAVHEGQHVSQGQKLGEMDASGNATGCHVHFALKTGFPASGDVNNFWLDGGKGGQGSWSDPWGRLAQNVTVRPKNLDGIRIRSALSLADSAIYAETAGDGHIHRQVDDADLGATSSWRKWDGIVAGPTYSVSGSTSNRWERIWLANRWLFLASLLAQRSAS